MPQIEHIAPIDKNQRQPPSIPMTQLSYRKEGCKNKQQVIYLLLKTLSSFFLVACFLALRRKCVGVRGKQVCVWGEEQHLPMAEEDSPTDHHHFASVKSSWML
ncbi:hypothetical protein CDAR_384331 [Caerostris darwini]|uniref:Uncharacterized protein n=1 Tax=Caerostris darwini TaxID=1538125 RepID=A0AAV4M547_9ARAC|nr:hypothetical protein CDAR_384331 [Caerostris darwini]